MSHQISGKALIYGRGMAPDDYATYLAWADEHDPEGSMSPQQHFNAMKTPVLWRSTSPPEATVAHDVPAPTPPARAALRTTAPALDVSVRLPKAPPAVGLDFDWVWSHYPSEHVSPRAIAKSAFDQQIRTEEDYELLVRSIERYSRSTSDRSKMFALANFLGRGVWRDYATAGSNADESVPGKPRLRPIDFGHPCVRWAVPEDEAEVWPKLTSQQQRDYLVRTGRWDSEFAQFFPGTT